MARNTEVFDMIGRLKSPPRTRWRCIARAIGVLSFAITFPSQGWSAAGAASEGETAETPGPAFSASGGIYRQPFKVALTSSKGVVRFSMDGTEPNLNSTIYKDPIEITNCAVLRARAFLPDGSATAIRTESYFLAGDDLKSFKSGLPIVVMNSIGEEISPTQKVFASVTIISNTAGQATLSTGDKSAFLALLHVRGHSSLRYPKHSYAVKAVNELRDSQKISLLGLSRDSDWVLYGPYPDKTLIRDVLAYDLSNKMGRWAPRSRFVEVFVNENSAVLSMSHYAGVYVLLEKITQNKDRVGIAKLSVAASREPDISGGYIFKKDHAGVSERKKFGAEGPPQAAQVNDRTGYPTPPGGFPADPAGFLPSYTKPGAANKPVPAKPTRALSPAAAAKAKKAKPKPNDPSQPRTNHIALNNIDGPRVEYSGDTLEEDGFRTSLKRNQFYFYDPEPDDITPVQRGWLKDYVNRFETALYGPDFKDPAKGYRAFIDPDSFIDHHLLVEATKNVDGFRFSTFFYKDRGGRINMGPAWDWNLSFGNASGKQGYMPEHWLWPQLDDTQYSWFRRLFEDADLAQRYVDRWAQLRTNVLATSNVLDRIDAMAKQLNDAQARNFAKWEIMGMDISPNYFVGNSYGEEIDWMKEWTSKRLAWMEAQFLRAPQLRLAQQLEMASTASNAEILYTEDGTDPRAPGGEPSPKAKVYQGPIAAPQSGRILARVRSGTRWSAPAELRSR